VLFGSAAADLEFLNHTQPGVRLGVVPERAAKVQSVAPVIEQNPDKQDCEKKR
jgi:hypothetical protein